MAFRRAGHGPAILLIHGIAGSSKTWEQVIPLLARDHTVVAADLIGHGDSDKPPGDYSLGAHASALRDLLSVLGIERVTVVGQSFGGGVAMQMSYQYPENCERLVLVDSGGLGRDVSWLLRLLTVPGVEYTLPVLFPRFVRDRGNQMLQFLHRAGFRHARAVEVWRAYASLTESENRMAFVRTLRSVVDPGGQSVNAMDRLYLAARMPTLIIWGDQDKIIPVRHAHDAHEALPGSRLEIIEGAGHFPQVEEPVRFAEILSDFMDDTRPFHFTAAQRRQMLMTHVPPAS
ncbi:MAG TPA: alpha/beta fold hydrolase [Acidimicrobiales bacterium]|nr:alpha/beta fold hydrolase [Acidimicrobiales bacterium]